MLTSAKVYLFILSCNTSKLAAYKQLRQKYFKAITNYSIDTFRDSKYNTTFLVFVP